MSKDLCIGLFGTCGNSKWRDKFVKRYQIKSVNFFNPLKTDWKPEDSVIEAEHLANDAIILFAITQETFSTASLAETGYAILNAITSVENRFVIIYIDSNVNPLLAMENPQAAKESKNARAIITSHLKHVKHSNIYFVDSLDKMLDFSVMLYKAAELISEAEGKL